MKRCKTCKWWHGNDLGTTGCRQCICMNYAFKPDRSNEFLPGALCLIGPWSGRHIIATNSEFGCVNHKEWEV